MKYQQMKKIFNTIIDSTTDTSVNDIEQYLDIVNQHAYVYAHNEYFIGITISYQVKEKVIEPLYTVTPVVKIDGTMFAVLVPSEEVTRISEVLFTEWKKGDKDYFELFPSANLHSQVV